MFGIGRNSIIALVVLCPSVAYAVPASLIHSTSFGASPPPPSTLVWDVGGNSLTLSGLQPTVIETEFGIFPTDAQTDWIINRENAWQYGLDFDAWADTLRNPSQWPVSRVSVNGNIAEHQVLGPPGIFTLDRLEVHIVYPLLTTPDFINAHRGSVVAQARGDFRFVPEPACGLLLMIAWLIVFSSRSFCRTIYNDRVGAIPHSW
jgi:hypothetical protein